MRWTNKLYKDLKDLFIFNKGIVFGNPIDTSVDQENFIPVDVSLIDFHFSPFLVIGKKAEHKNKTSLRVGH